VKPFFILLFCYLICSCTEVPVVLPNHDPNPGNTITQNVLIEEYTGVRCQNCPAGALLLEELKAIHGKRLVILSIHGGFFAQPTNVENKLNLDNPFGRELITAFDQPQGYPSAMIDRKIFDGQSSRFLGGNFWAGYIDQEKNKSPQVGIDLNTTLNDSTRKLSITVLIQGLIDLSAQPLFLSVALAENNIKDAQLTPVGIDTTYIHRHVMRTFLGSVFGNALEPITPNQTTSYNFNVDIPVEWNLNQLYIAAFVHKPGTSYEVLQVVEEKLHQ
jgi:hypothetical protein